MGIPKDIISAMSTFVVCFSFNFVVDFFWHIFILKIF